MYFSATCISRMLVRVVLILPKVWEVKLKSGLPQFGWFGEVERLEPELERVILDDPELLMG